MSSSRDVERAGLHEAKAYVRGLLVDEATQGLCSEKVEELDLLVERSELDKDERDSWALTAALCEMAFASESLEAVAGPVADPQSEATPARDGGALVALPQDVEERLAAMVRQASRNPDSALRQPTGASSRVLAFDRAPGGAVPAGASASPRSSAVPSGSSPSERPPSGSSASGTWLPWVLTAAAVVMAILGWGRATRQADPTPAVIAGAEEMAPPTDQFELPFQATTDPAAAGATGEVTWSPNRQTGVMHLVGLQVNDPAVEQYQLWIFDAERDQSYPVDGGVFDVTSQDVTIPIEAKIGVSKATLFAITVERPGGVVVSGRERIVLTAAPA